MEDAGYPGEFGRVGGGIGVRDTGGALADDVQGVGGLGREMLTDLLGHDAAGGARGQGALVGEAEPQPEHRGGGDEQDGERRAPGEHGTPHDGQRRAVPEAAGGRTCRCGGPFDAVAPADQRGGQDDDGARNGRQHDQDAGVGERTEEEEREDQQRRQGHGDGQAAEQDGPASRGDRTRHGVLGGEPRGAFLAVAVDQEEAVVDAESESEDQGEVGRERGHRCELGQEPQPRQRAEDREQADADGEQGGNGAPVDEDQQEQDGGQDDDLGGQEVPCGLLADLPGHLLLPADGHGDVIGGAGQLRGEVGQFGTGVGGAALQAGQHQCPSAVGAAQGRVAVVPVGGDVGDHGVPGQFFGEPSPRIGDVPTVDVAVRGGDQQRQIRIAGAVLLAEHVLDTDGFGTGRVPAGQVEVALRAGAVDTEAQEQHEGGQEHRSPAPDREPAESAEWPAAVPVSLCHGCRSFPSRGVPPRCRGALTFRWNDRGNDRGNDRWNASTERCGGALRRNVHGNVRGSAPVAGRPADRAGPVAPPASGGPHLPSSPRRAGSIRPAPGLPG